MPQVPHQHVPQPHDALLPFFFGFFHIIIVCIFNILHPNKSVLVEKSEFRLQNRGINLNLAPHPQDQKTQMHTIRYRLDITLGNFD